MSGQNLTELVGNSMSHSNSSVSLRAFGLPHQYVLADEDSLSTHQDSAEPVSLKSIATPSTCFEDLTVSDSEGADMNNQSNITVACSEGDLPVCSITTGSGGECNPSQASGHRSAQSLHYQGCSEIIGVEHSSAKEDEVCLSQHMVEVIEMERITKELTDQLQIPPPLAPPLPQETLVEPFPFSLLPLELKLYVLSFLTQNELFGSVVLVCREWSDLAHDPILTQHLVFSEEMAISTKKMLHILSSSTMLKSLQLEVRRDMDKILPQLADTCGQLRHLTAMFCDGINSVLLKLLVKNCPLIEKINFEGSQFDDAECVAALTGLKKLRVLNVSHCLRFEDAQLEEIARECTELEELFIDGMGYLSDKAVVNFVKFCYEKLQLLVLDGESLNDEAFRALGRLQQLVSLSISFADNMTDASVPYLRMLTGLLSLKIRRAEQLSDRGLASLFAHSRLPSLTRLDLSGCSNLSDATVKSFTYNCPLLTHLTLGWCWEITDYGLEHIIDRLQLMRLLDLLGVVRITGVCFSQIPQCLPELRVLNLEQCSSIHEHVVDTVVRLLPHLKVYDYYGDQVVPQDDQVDPEDDLVFLLDDLAS